MADWILDLPVCHLFAAEVDRNKVTLDMLQLQLVGGSDIIGAIDMVTSPVIDTFGTS